jgi:hypothetical protein
MQAAQAYDKAARSIRGSSAICNFPANEQEAQNTAKYLSRLAASAGRCRHNHAESGGMPVCTRRLTVRQRARLESSGSRGGTAKTGKPGAEGLVEEASGSKSRKGGAEAAPSAGSSNLATKKIITKGGCRARAARPEVPLDRVSATSGSSGVASSAGVIPFPFVFFCLACMLPLFLAQRSSREVP